MNRNRIMRWGNANVRPIEYYGGDSGRYFETLPPTGTFAYGNYHPVSHGVIDGTVNVSGPNIGVYPGSSLQTGGHCGCEKRVTRRRSARRGRGRSARRGRGRSARRGKGRSARRGRGRSARSRRSRRSRN